MLTDAFTRFSTVFAPLRNLSAPFLHPNHGFDPEAEIRSMARRLAIPMTQVVRFAIATAMRLEEIFSVTWVTIIHGHEC